MSESGSWLPDGHGLDPLSIELVTAWRPWLLGIIGDESISDVRAHDLVLAWAEEALLETAAPRALSDSTPNRSVYFGNEAWVQTTPLTSTAAEEDAGAKCRECGGS